jgi:SPFH domain / Band 7 family
MSVSQELVMAAGIAEDPTKLVMAIPATVVGVGAAAKSFTIVHQSEKGVRTRRGAPMLKPEISSKIISELADELPDLRIKYFSWDDLSLDKVPTNLPDLRTRSDYVKGRMLEYRNRPEARVKQLEKHDLRERIAEKIENLDDEIKEQGIYQIAGRGIVWLYPFIDSVVKINIADQTTPLEPFELESNDTRQRQVLITPSLTWNVRPDADNPYKALFNINNEKETKIKNKTQELEQTVGWICAEALGIVLRDMKYDDLKNFEPDNITKATSELCEKDLLRYGVNLGAVRLKPNVRTSAERIAQAIEGNPELTKAEKAAIVASSALASDNKRGGLSAVPDQAA